MTPLRYVLTPMSPATGLRCMPAERPGLADPHLLLSAVDGPLHSQHVRVRVRVRVKPHTKPGSPRAAHAGTVVRPVHLRSGPCTR